ncbi:hypothetical protein ACIBM4_17365 [Streptomyces sp. NPDC050256]|uniref:hypothetical protein n=1 Tax=unclassified Streptomyces TaxID=2593676 RepID=UPI0037AE8DDE
MSTIGTTPETSGPPTPSPRIGGTLLTGGALIVLSVTAALTSHTAFTDWLPTERAQYLEYGAAEACPDPTATVSAEDCLREIPFTVEGTKNTSKRKYATLTGPELFPRETVPFGKSGPVLHELERGDLVTGTVWRGLIVVVAKGDARQTTSDAPRDEPQMTAAVGTFAGLLAALALMFGAIRLVRPRNPGHFTWRPYGKWLLIVSGISCGVIGLATVWWGLPWVIVPMVCGSAFAITAWFLHRDLRLGRLTS